MSPSVANPSKKNDYYTVLGLSAPRRAGDQLTNDSLRTAYRRALLTNHPDKVAGQQAAQKGTEAGEFAFTVDQIAQAYETLSDPVSRSKYDQGLLKNKARLVAKDTSGSGAGLETLDLEDLDYNDSTQTWSKKCRCGGTYLVCEQELGEAASEGEVIASCYGCSLCIRITFGMVDQDNAVLV